MRPIILTLNFSAVCFPHPYELLQIQAAAVTNCIRLAQDWAHQHSIRDGLKKPHPSQRSYVQLKVAEGEGIILLSGVDIGELFPHTHTIPHPCSCIIKLKI